MEKLLQWELLLGRPIWVVVKLHKSRNNPGVVFVQKVKDSNLAVKIEIYYCNPLFHVLYYTQVEAIQTTQAEAEAERIR